MPALRMLTNVGTGTMVRDETLQAFQACIAGSIIRPGGADYDSARKTWNGLIDKRPALIVRCTGVADVIAAVRFARDYDPLVAVRGGGNFGIVTSFEYQLHPVGPVLAGMILHPIDRAREALRFYREFTATAPDELTTYALLLTTPEGVAVVALSCCYCGDLAVGEQVLHPLRRFGPPLADEVKPMPYQAWQSILYDAYPPGLFNYDKSHFVSRLTDELIDTVIDCFANIRSPMSALGFEQFGGAVSRVAADETAFPHRDAPYDIVIIGEWADPATSAVNVQ